jgi:8-oxo-dGTP pyrophosphatase MutT (NUDIX family)
VAFLVIMQYETLKNKLLQRFDQPLPGKEVQYEMASYHRYKNTFDSNIENAKLSAVSILIYLLENEWHFCLIQRPQYNGPHSGQMALPGGKKEVIDFDLMQTAIRETKEEIGIELRQEDIVGKLTELFIPVSNTLVLPFTAIINHVPTFIPQQTEVVEIIECKITHLLSQTNNEITEVKINESLTIKTPYFSLNNKIVWGATAMILNEFKKIWEDSMNQ